jgi:uncharacterized Zn finger protein
MPSSIHQLLKREISTSSLARGRVYANEGRVDNWELEAGGQTLTADVEGTELYHVDIVLTWSSRGVLTDFTGFCSCPVGLNCKHVVAALLIAEASDAFSGISKTRKTQSRTWGYSAPDPHATGALEKSTKKAPKKAPIRLF